MEAAIVDQCFGLSTNVHRRFLALDKIVPVLAGKIGEALTTLIEDEIKKCLETHVAPIKEAIDNQQKTIDSNKEKICKQYIWLDKLDKQVKRNENTIQEHDAELES
jgi:enamine deaminase RidA (YjgF/YER057c/UK114 family)